MTFRQLPPTYITASLSPGPIVEPSVTSQEYLDSFLEFGCWLRPLATWQHLKVLLREDVRELEALGSLSAFYQLAGQVVEDALTMLIAWSIWSRDEQQALPDIVERLQLRLSAPKESLGIGYMEKVWQKFRKNDKRIDVYAREYIEELFDLSDEQLPLALGIKWKKYPSVKLIPADFIPLWNNLGKYIKDSFVQLRDPRGALLASCYNKIKHGPQIIIASAAQALENRGHNIDTVNLPLKSLAIRLLMQGSRLQENSTESSQSHRAAPFLMDDPKNAKRWFFQQIIHTSNAVFLTGMLIFNTTYIRSKRPFRPTRQEVLELVEEQAKHTESF